MKSNNFDLVLFSALFATIYVISNIIAVKQVEIIGMVVTCSFISYPLTFVISNIVNERLGIKDARKVVFVGLITMLVTVALTSIGYYIHATDKDIEAAYKLIFENNILILLSSVVAFIVSQTVNFILYNGMARSSKMFRYLISILLALFIDALIFKTLMWYFGVADGDVLMGILNQTIFGLATVLIATPFFYVFTIDSKIDTKKTK